MSPRIAVVLAAAALVTAVAAPCASATANLPATSLGMRFTLVASPTGQHNAQYSQPSCLSTRWCDVISVGRNTVVDHYDGTRLRALPRPPRQKNNYEALACPTKRMCMLVGNYDRGRFALPSSATFNGHRWKVLPMPHPPLWRRSIDNEQPRDPMHWEPTSVSCASARSCVAVGSGWSYGPDSQYDVPLIEAWNGTRWRIEQAALKRGPLDSVSCASPGMCMATGLSAQDDWPGATELLSGGRWHKQTIPTQPPLLRFAGLDGVSCSSTVHCVAVGMGASHQPAPDSVDGGGDPNAHSLVAEWSHGRWTDQELALGRGKGLGTETELRSVSCPRNVHDTCTATGDLYLGGEDVFARLGSTGWRQTAFSPTSDIPDLSCPTRTFCLAAANHRVVAATG